MAQAGMDCRWRVVGPQRWMAEAVQRKSPLRILAGALPQRAVWVVDGSGEELRVASDFRLFRWYAALVFLLWLLLASGFLGSTAIARRPHRTEGEETVGLVLILAALVLVPLVLRLFRAFGGHTEPLWSEILYRIERTGGSLSPKGRFLSKRSSTFELAFFVSVLLLTVWFLIGGENGSIALPRGLPIFFAVVGALLVLLCATLVLMAGRQGFNLRVYAIGAGLLSLMAVFMALMAVLLPPWLVSRLNLATLGPRLPGLGQRTMGTSLFLAAVAAFMVVFTVQVAAQVRPQLERIQARVGQGLYKAAAGAVSPWPFRAVFMLSWLLLSTLLLAGLIVLVLCAVEGIVPFSSLPELRLVEVSQTLVAAALGLSPDSPLLTVAVRGVWVVAASGGLGLLAVSVGQLVRSRRRTRRYLVEASRRPFSGRDEVEARLAEIRRKTDLAPCRLALSRSASVAPSAQSYRFGLWRPERFIEISESCLDLAPEELDALLCHESAHDLLGHLATDVFWRWLGRLSFVGDGFVRAVQDSFGYEKAADQVARDRLGAREDALKRLLRENPAGPILPSVQPSSRRERWRVALYEYRIQYFGLGPRLLHYWHPDARTRRDALRGAL